MATNNFYRTPYLTTISFAAGILLFFLPFVDVKCSGQTVATMSGMNMVTGSSSKNSSDMGFDRMANPFDSGKDSTTIKTKTEKDGKSYMLAVAALALAIGGLIVSVIKKGGYNKLEILLGIAGAISLIALMIQVKSDVGDQIKTQSNSTANFNGIADITVDFTIWFFLCLVSYLAAAFFSYKQKDLVNAEAIPPANAPQLDIKNPGDQSDFPAATSGDKNLG